MMTEAAPAESKSTHPFKGAFELLASFALVFVFVKLSSFAAFAELVSDLPQVSDWSGFITLGIPGLDKYGANIAVALTGITALGIGASAHRGTSSHLGVMTAMLTIPSIALALSGLSPTVWVALVGAGAGLVITHSRNDYVPSRLLNIIVWAVSVGFLYWGAVAFARA